MTNQVACDSQFFASLLPTGGGTPCPPGSSYPTQTQVVMHPLPAGLATMPQPCAGVPENPWCVAPVIHSARMTPRTWRRGTRLPRASRRSPLGTTISVNLNEAAKMRLAFSQARAGRRVGRRCVAPSRANRHRRACVRTVSVGSMSFNAHGGVNRIRFQGRLSRRHTLRPGRYKLTITATDEAGSRSRARVLAFTVLAR
jgi:hypothetical protein